MLFRSKGVTKRGQNRPGSRTTLTHWTLTPNFGQEISWCRRRDLNPHEHSSLPPQDSVSTNSTTSAILLSAPHSVCSGDITEIIDLRDIITAGNVVTGRQPVPFWHVVQHGGTVIAFHRLGHGHLRDRNIDLARRF